MMFPLYRLLPGAALLAAAFSAATAEIVLPPVFSDGCVLLRGPETPVWGTADPGEIVRVEVAGRKAEAVADAAGAWLVRLDLSQAAADPQQFIVEGKSRRVINDVLIGQVWLCSGQSNMEFPVVSTINAAAETSKPANPLIRLFQVGKNYALQPLGKADGQWLQAGPQTVGNFSAVAYFFALAMQKKSGQPIGLISANWGGTPSEAWTSEQALRSDPGIWERAGKIQEAERAYPESFRRYVSAYKLWERDNKRQDDPAGDAKTYASETVDEAGWEPVTLPGLPHGSGSPESGAVWFRKSIVVPEVAAGQVLPLLLGNIREFDEVYWNGERVGKTTFKTPADPGMRIYGVPANLVKAGPAVISMRIFNPIGRPGTESNPGDFRAGNIPLAGEWLAKSESSLPAPDDAAKQSFSAKPMRMTAPQNVPASLFNAMISPLIPYGLSGILWYQGEANAERAVQYRRAFPLLINDWRARWGQKSLPFYYCQLANYRDKNTAPMESDWAELREAQAMALRLPETGMAVLIEAGEEADIHPRDKVIVGERLAALASVSPGQPGRSGPMYLSSKVQGNQIVVTFENPGSDLVATALPRSYAPRSSDSAQKTTPINSPGSQLQGFQICGDDRKWRWAHAQIAGKNTVKVWADGISQPLAVRYAWADNPTCNLSNREGLPTAPFRTDDYPEITR